MFWFLCCYVFFFFPLRTYITHHFSPSSLIFSCLYKLSSYFCICTKKFLLNPKLLYIFKVFFALYVTLHHYCLCLPFLPSNFVLTFTYKSAVDPWFLKLCMNLDVPISNTAIFTLSTWVRGSVFCVQYLAYFMAVQDFCLQKQALFLSVSPSQYTAISWVHLLALTDISFFNFFLLSHKTETLSCLQCSIKLFPWDVRLYKACLLDHEYKLLLSWTQDQIFHLKLPAPELCWNNIRVCIYVYVYIYIFIFNFGFGNLIFVFHRNDIIKENPLTV